MSSARSEPSASASISRFRAAQPGQFPLDLCAPGGLLLTRVRQLRLITETGNKFDVSPLYRIDGSWAFSICGECAKRLMAVAIFFLIIALS